MEISMVPSQFLSVVLEEEQGSSGEEEEDDDFQLYAQRDWENSVMNHSTLSRQETWDLTKHLPKALLAECTVEISRTPVNYKKKTRSPCFDARVSPIYSKPSSKRRHLPRQPELEASEWMEEKMDVQDLLTGVEAVYSDEESNKDEAAVSIMPVKYAKPEKPKPDKKTLDPNNASKYSFQCEHCPNVYPNRGALWQHSVATHSVEKTCECTICGRKFYRNCSLALHLKSHSEEEYCECKECGKSFNRLSNLERHMKSVHIEIEQYPCNNCDKVFRDKANLLRHAVVHSAPKMYPCEICNKSYKSPDHLEIHFQTSHTETLLTCSTCGDIFKSFSELMKHDATHSTDKPFLCRFCGKSYSQKSILRKHMIIHTGERLTCTTCGIDFTQKSSLLRHIKRLHQPCQEGVDPMSLLDGVSMTESSVEEAPSTASEENETPAIVLSGGVTITKTSLSKEASKTPVANNHNKIKQSPKEVTKVALLDGISHSKMNSQSSSSEDGDEDVLPSILSQTHTSSNGEITISLTG
uniref:C2H2-type domain-containing protein n=1 Tax=Clastoptera arizonana TaxID=38151 RepID=A0A1B6DNH4_9HEMI